MPGGVSGASNPLARERAVSDGLTTWWRWHDALCILPLPTVLSMTTYSRPVLLLLCGLLLLTLAIAVLNTLVPLWLAHEHLPTWQVGMVGSAYFTGNLLGTLLAGLIARRGFNRSYYLASALFAAGGCVGLGLITLGFWSWLAWRFIAGVGCASDLGGGGERADVQRQRPQPGRLLAAYDGLLRGHCARATAGQQGADVADGGAALGDRSGAGGHLALLFTRIVNAPRQHQATTQVWPDAAPASGASGVNGCIISGIVLGSLCWPDAALSEPPG